MKYTARLVDADLEAAFEAVSDQRSTFRRDTVSVRTPRQIVGERQHKQEYDPEQVELEPNDRRSKRELSASSRLGSRH
jgi:hypothetical protein